MVVWKTILMRFNKALIFTIFFIAVQSYITTAVAANQWQGNVIYVVDGDTLHIRPLDAKINSKPRKIRIDGIDAPESCQSYGLESTTALKKLLASKTVTVFSKRVDDYGRDLAKITVKNIDVGAWMVSNGHAWSYHYRHSAGPYRAEEEAATRSRLGLFADAAAIEPRLFRKEHGSCHLLKGNSSDGGANAAKAAKAANGAMDVNAEHSRKRYK
jgi:micrococcal nuclease